VKVRTKAVCLTFLKPITRDFHREAVSTGLLEGALESRIVIRQIIRKQAKACMRMIGREHVAKTVTCREEPTKTFDVKLHGIRSSPI